VKLFSLVGFSCMLAAQEYRATLSGRITDPQGAVVAAVKIVAVQVETGSRFETLSGADGLYTIPFLPPSAYRLSAEAAGFKKYGSGRECEGAMVKRPF